MKIEYQTIDFKINIKLSLKHNLSFYDAAYLYLAKINKCKLLTLDKKLERIKVNEKNNKTIRLEAKEVQKRFLNFWIK